MWFITSKSALKHNGHSTYMHCRTQRLLLAAGRASQPREGHSAALLGVKTQHY